METARSEALLDEILAIQVTIAWAGEGRSTPVRLGWWDTDLISETGGGDFFARLLPRTHAWASLEAVREAARRVDARARGKMADPDGVRTLYFLGFELDERLRDRLREHKRSGVKPAEALGLPLPLNDEFSTDVLAAVLRGDVPYDTAPNGRRLRGAMPAQPEVLVKRLAAALLPFGAEYPLPFYEIGS